jgi:hypothetical protein
MGKKLTYREANQLLIDLLIKELKGWKRRAYPRKKICKRCGKVKQGGNE